MSVRTILADDHALVREALRTLIETRLPDVEILGEASTGVETLRLCREHQPDLLVLDISMPDLGGLEVLAELPSTSPRTKVAVVSQYSDRAYVIRALRLGAKAYVPKKALGKDLVTALQAVLEGRTYLDPTVADLVVDAAIHPEQDTEGTARLKKLTKREREVLRLTAEGRTAKEVAQVLCISPHTVNRHRANLMEKLGLHGKADLVKFAIQVKLIDT